MTIESLKELLKEGVTLDEQNVVQLTELFEQAILGERIKAAEEKEAEIATLKEEHASALTDAVDVANARIDEAVDVAVDKFIAESEARFVQTDEFNRMKNLFEGVKGVFEQNAFALNENAAADQANALLSETQADYDALFERHLELKDQAQAISAELETARRAIIFDKTTGTLTETQRERVGTLVENVEFETTDEFVTGLKMIVEMELKGEGKQDPEAGQVDPDPADEETKARVLKEQQESEQRARAADKSVPLHELDFDARMERYKS